MKKDFGVVFRALEMYEDHTKNEGLTHDFPKIILYITGEMFNFSSILIVKKRKGSWKGILSKFNKGTEKYLEKNWNYHRLAWNPRLP